MTIHLQNVCGTDILWSAITVFVPTRVSAFRHKPHHMKSRDLSKCAARKRKLWRIRCVEIPLTLKLVLSIDSVHMWRQILRKHQIVRKQSIVEVDNLGAFYQYVNQRISNRTSINAVVENGLILTHRTEKTNAFNRNFSSVGVRDNGFVPRCCMSAELNETLEFVIIKEEDVNPYIVKMKSSLSAGPDNLPPLLFKKVRRSISRPLAML